MSNSSYEVNPRAAFEAVEGTVLEPLGWTKGRDGYWGPNAVFANWLVQAILDAFPEAKLVPPEPPKAGVAEYGLHVPYSGERLRMMLSLTSIPDGLYSLAIIPEGLDTHTQQAEKLKKWETFRADALIDSESWNCNCSCATHFRHILSTMPKECEEG